MNTARVVDLCAGPGGWDEGARMLGEHDVVGIEWDPDACATAVAAGHARIQGDVAALDPAGFRPEVLIGSPPCTKFSMAGSGIGRDFIDVLADGIRALFAGRDTREEIRQAIYPACLAAREEANAARAKPWLRAKVEKAARDDAFSTVLVLEPARWIMGMPSVRAVALEQVPPVLPLWEVYAEELHSRGWSVWTGILNAADYGIVCPCPLHASDSQNPSAECVGPSSRYEIALGYAAEFATTEFDESRLTLVATAAARLANQIGPAFAGSATCDERERILKALAGSAGQTTPLGSEVASWTTEATSRFELTPGTAASIASLLSNCLADPSVAARWSTTSTGTRRTIVRQISRCIAAILITGCSTGPTPQARPAGCGLCVDVAVPQTRRRAILTAHRNQRVTAPIPTHAQDPQPALFGQLLPWVSMAEALGWGFDEPSATVSSGGAATGGAEVFGNADCRRRLAAIVTNQRAPGSDDYFQRSVSEPSPTLTSNGHLWKFVASSQTVAGDPRIAPPGHRDRAGGERQHEHSVRVTVGEAAVLQSFRPDYPWAGSKTKKFLQVGNAVPPLLAAHVLASVGVRGRVGVDVGPTHPAASRPDNRGQGPP